MTCHHAANRRPAGCEAAPFTAEGRRLAAQSRELGFDEGFGHLRLSDRERDARHKKPSNKVLSFHRTGNSIGCSQRL